MRLTARREKSQTIVEWLRDMEMSDQTKSERSDPTLRQAIIKKLSKTGHLCTCGEQPTLSAEYFKQNILPHKSVSIYLPVNATCHRQKNSVKLASFANVNSNVHDQ